jgi:phage terminase small subunit
MTSRRRPLRKTKRRSLSSKKLNPRESIYVDARLTGMSQVASAAAAGYKNPNSDGSDLEKRPHVQAAMVKRMEDTSREVDFSRREAHDLLMNAYVTADTAMEQIAAVREMIKLHGLAAPLKVEHKHNHGGTVQLEHMETTKLMELAGMDLALEGEFEVLTNPKRVTHKEE